MSTYPDHYTPDDIRLVDEIKSWLTERDYTQAALARLARVSPASLSQILGGTYATPPAPQLVKVRNALDNAGAASSDGCVAVRTSVFEVVETACRIARQDRNFSVVSAAVGTGKTFALKHYDRVTPNTYLVEATPTMTVQSLIKHLARAMAGYDGKGGIDERFRRIVDKVVNADVLVIIDEAETLTPHVLNTVRRLRDLANIGVVLAGTEHLTGIIEPKFGQFDQIRSRIGFWSPTIPAITDADVALLVQSAFGAAEAMSDEFIARLYAYCKGSARMLMDGLIPNIKRFRRGQELTPALVDAVAKKAMSLQSAR